MAVTRTHSRPRCIASPETKRLVVANRYRITNASGGHCRRTDGRTAPRIPTLSILLSWPERKSAPTSIVLLLSGDACGSRRLPFNVERKENEEREEREKTTTSETEWEYASFIWMRFGLEPTFSNELLAFRPDSTDGVQRVSTTPRSTLNTVAQ